VKILMVSEDLPGAQIGGLGKHVVTLSNALLEQGHEVDIMGRSDRFHAGSAQEIGFQGRLLPGFAFARPGWKEAQLGFFNPVKRPWFARRVARALMREAGNYDVVHYHGHLPMAGRYVPPGVNFVQTRHDQGSECVIHLRFKQEHVCETRDVRDCAACIHPAPNSLRRTVSGMAVGRYRLETAESFARHKTVFVSDFLRRAFLRAVPDADLSRARVIHNFIRYPMLREQAATAGEVRAGEVMLVGRIDSGKGFGEFLAQVQGWLPPHARVTIIGDGPLRPQLEARYAGAGSARAGQAVPGAGPRRHAGTGSLPVLRRPVAAGRDHAAAGRAAGRAARACASDGAASPNLSDGRVPRHPPLTGTL
jgi:glycogen(starch) synthase